MGSAGLPLSPPLSFPAERSSRESENRVLGRGSGFNSTRTDGMQGETMKEEVLKEIWDRDQTIHRRLPPEDDMEDLISISLDALRSRRHSQPLLSLPSSPSSSSMSSAPSLDFLVAPELINSASFKRTSKQRTASESSISRPSKVPRSIRPSTQLSPVMSSTEGLGKKGIPRPVRLGEKRTKSAGNLLEVVETWETELSKSSKENEVWETLQVGKISTQPAPSTSHTRSLSGSSRKACSTSPDSNHLPRPKIYPPLSPRFPSASPRLLSSSTTGTYESSIPLPKSRKSSTTPEDSPPSTHTPLQPRVRAKTTNWKASSRRTVSSPKTENKHSTTLSSSVAPDNESPLQPSTSKARQRSFSTSAGRRLDEMSPGPGPVPPWISNRSPTLFRSEETGKLETTGNVDERVLPAVARRLEAERLAKLEEVEGLIEAWETDGTPRSLVTPTKHHSSPKQEVSTELLQTPVRTNSESVPIPNLEIIDNAGMDDDQIPAPPSPTISNRVPQQSIIPDSPPLIPLPLEPKVRESTPKSKSERPSSITLNQENPLSHRASTKEGKGLDRDEDTKGAACCRCVVM